MDYQVSVIIPAFNRAGLIEQTLESVAVQSMKVDEIIVVDDGSGDGTSDVVSSWFSRRHFAGGKLKTLPANVGKPAAVNIALSESRGEFIIILDSDDILRADAVARQASFLRSHWECGLVFGLAYEMHGHTKSEILTGGFGSNEECSDVLKVTGDLLLRVNPIVSSSVMFRRSCYRDVGGMEPHLRYTHDWEYWIRISRRVRMGFLPVPLVYYRMDTANSSSANRLGTFREVAALLALEADRFPGKVLQRSLFRHLRFNALVALKDGRIFQLLGMVWHAVRTTLRFVTP